MKTIAMICGLAVGIAVTCVASATELTKFVNELTRRDRAFVVLPETTDLQEAHDLTAAGHVVLALAGGEQLQNLRGQADDGLGTDLFVKSGDVRHIPLADNYANLVLVTKRVDWDQRALAEIVRAVAPLGAAAIRAPTADVQKLQQSLADENGVSFSTKGDWFVLRKAAAEGSDNWSYWNHSPSNNPVSDEKNVSWPLQTQWLGKPFFVTRHSFALVSDGIYYTGKRAEWNSPGTYIEARDAYNGLRLWRKEMPSDINLMLPTWIATNGKLYGTLGNEVLEFDGATGTELSRSKIGNEDQQIKWLVRDGNAYLALLGFADVAKYTSHTQASRFGDYIPLGETLVAHDNNSGKDVWRIDDEGIDARAIGMLGPQIYYYARNKHLRAIDSRSGKILWSNAQQDLMRAMASPLDPGGAIDGITLYRPGLLCTSEVIVLNLQARAKRAGFDAATGKLLWENGLHAGNFGRGGSMLAFQGHLHAKGMRPSPIDLRTGEAATEKPFRIGGGCGRDTATATGLIGFLGECVTPDGTVLSGTKLAKPECHLGSFAANGLLFNPQGSCGCALPLVGLLVECPGDSFDFTRLVQADKRLATYASAPTDELSSGLDWTTWAGSNDHSGFVPVKVGREPRSITWTAKPTTIAAPVPPISVGNATFVADVGSRLRAIGAEGELLWQHLAGAAFHAAPTYWRGMIFAGCADGRVYCLHAAKGKPIWTFRAAPLDHNIMVYGRLSSAWPVNSGVLIHEGVCYFMAGLTDRDGMLAYALNATSGEIEWVNPNLGWIDPDRREGLNCNSYLTIFDGQLRFNSGSVQQAALNLKTGEPVPFPLQPRIMVDGDRAITTGIGCIRDRLLVRGANRPFFDVETRLARGTRFAFKLPGDNAESMFTVAPYQASRCMPVWDQETLFVTRDERFEKNLQAWDIGATEEWVREIVAPKADEADRQYRFTIATSSLRDKAQPKPLWSKDLEVVGLAASDDAVLAIATAFENPRQRSGEQTWTLQAFEKRAGNEMWSVPLPGPPAVDSLVIRSDETVVVALLDGTIVAVGQ